MLQRKLLAVAGSTALALAACDRQPPVTDRQFSAAVDREPRKHAGSISDPRPLESVTGVLLFERGCWVVRSGRNRIALFFPRESKLVVGKDIQVGPRRLSVGEAYKFVGDLSETAVDKLPTCNGLPSSIGVGDVWPLLPEQQPWQNSQASGNSKNM